ncbi:uncharacterized protein LOC117045442 [Lacerta agilis]|uniref:uncharacterized protein LOC117045442 n=1 Tax=Lacerta agilis TaxID=80427 RepID=UPI001419BE95|nr:uncharacterized protein LOC117045442 [Lacerta agilis]XP_033002384.1 uncharacterized protein LOC117045442 [Lacerta agilis]
MSCFRSAKTDKPLETSEEIKEEIEGEIHCRFLETAPRPSFMSHLTYSEISLELTKVIGQLYVDGEPEENQLDGELLYSSNYKATDNPAQPPSQFLPRPNSDKKLGRAPETIQLIHRLNSCTCSHLRSSRHRINSKIQIGQVTNIEASLPEDQEEEEEEDVFTELPMRGTALESLDKTCISQTKRNRDGHISNKGAFTVIAGNNPTEKELKERKMHQRVRQHDFML